MQHQHPNTQCRLMSIIMLTLALSSTVVAETVSNAKPIYGDFKDWRILGVSHRLDRQYVRSIVGNNLAIKAGRSGNTKPWPDGTIIAKLSWKQQTDPHWPQAIIPGDYVGAEAMVKDSKKYPETGGWGFGHWEGQTLVMNDQVQTATCFACHSPMKDQDYVYTKPVFGQ